jgi:hypothetical protein
VANVKNDEFETLDFADESEWMEQPYDEDDEAGLMWAEAFNGHVSAGGRKVDAGVIANQAVHPES